MLSCDSGLSDSDSGLSNSNSKPSDSDDEFSGSDIFFLFASFEIKIEYYGVWPTDLGSYLCVLNLVLVQVWACCSFLTFPMSIVRVFQGLSCFSICHFLQV